MKTRIVSALIMLPLLAVLYVGGLLLTGFCFLISVIGIREFYQGFRQMGRVPSYPVALLSMAGLYAIGIFTPETEWFLMWAFASVLASLLILFNMKDKTIEDATATLTGIFYVGFFSFHVTLIDQTGPTGILVWLVVFAAFGSDVMAYFTGMAIGRHKLCPEISPKKTIEGAIGGILGSVLVCGLFGHFFAPQYFVHCLVIGVLGAVISQCGDLTASAFKRRMGIKDYGNLIPGHGGILDRFDSVLFTAPGIYYYIVLVIQ